MNVIQQLKVKRVMPVLAVTRYEQIRLVDGAFIAHDVLCVGTPLNFDRGLEMRCSLANRYDLTVGPSWERSADRIGLGTCWRVVADVVLSAIAVCIRYVATRQDASS